ncbi:hypothetical protein A0J61_10384 [Choanephora cucurbitarum]|uniref:Uncharacterized protein n=1 Tax=Choanephora cucurbitarum TaxID=101091 RepID=A0A1C7MYT6_9FUNG|nr:hypothetical protein A0J61_10384 [Choanephora cucurbitarum]
MKEEEEDKKTRPISRHIPAGLIMPRQLGTLSFDGQPLQLYHVFCQEDNAFSIIAVTQGRLDRLLPLQDDEMGVRVTVYGLLDPEILGIAGQPDIYIDLTFVDDIDVLDHQVPLSERIRTLYAEEMDRFRAWTSIPFVLHSYSPLPAACPIEVLAYADPDDSLPDRASSPSSNKENQPVQLDSNHEEEEERNVTVETMDPLPPSVVSSEEVLNVTVEIVGPSVSLVASTETITLTHVEKTPPAKPVLRRSPRLKRNPTEAKEEQKTVGAKKKRKIEVLRRSPRHANKKKVKYSC